MTMFFCRHYFGISLLESNFPNSGRMEPRPDQLMKVVQMHSAAHRLCFLYHSTQNLSSFNLGLLIDTGKDFFLVRNAVLALRPSIALKVQ